ncbi:MAG TPA: YicC family protein [Flavobacteriales bacterium]|nr:YicC family protein [Crocinitomicaceae bacterium]HAE29744.1 YicC family protein [Flavobacteriales bacterium]
MILSMTGFGKAEGTIGNNKFNVEIRSVNSKQFDLSVRMPAIYKEKEIPLRNKLSKELYRGKIDLSIQFDSNGADHLSAVINHTVVKKYYEQIESLSNDLGLNPAPSLIDILRLPDTMKQERLEVDEEEWELVMKLIEQAIKNFISFRKQEGEAILNEFNVRINNIEQYANEIIPYEKERTESVRDKIESLFSEYEERESVDNNRLEQEMIYYLEKLDITEERSRLFNHIKYFRETLDSDTPQGKKLGFICQELGREINTMGSKANHATIQKLVVQMKDELEKIKEQVLNAL